MGRFLEDFGLCGRFGAVHKAIGCVVRFMGVVGVVGGSSSSG